MKITKGDGLVLSPNGKARRQFLVGALPDANCSILEIGALDDPTFLAEEGNVKYADFFTREESVARHQHNPNRRANRIVPVDYVLRDTTLPEAVAERADIVIANHVIEHVPDPIQWLRDIHQVSAQYLFLSIPDRRYTFDYFKPVTDAVDWLRWHDEKLARPSSWQILRHIYYQADLRTAGAWQGNIPADHMNRYSMPAAIERAESLSASYTDVHCSIFTHDSFKRLMSDLAQIVPWRIVRTEDVRENSNEFRALLVRSS